MCCQLRLLINGPVLPPITTNQRVTAVEPGVSRPLIDARRGRHDGKQAFLAKECFFDLPVEAMRFSGAVSMRAASIISSISSHSLLAWLNLRT